MQLPAEAADVTQRVTQLGCFVLVHQVLQPAAYLEEDRALMAVSMSKW